MADWIEGALGAVGQFLVSPGFGGLAAVVAAWVAYRGVTRSVNAQREANRKQQWWERARWALDLTLSDDSTTRAIGLEVLDALGRSEYAGEHEFEVIDAALAPTLEAYAENVGQAYVEDGVEPGVAADWDEDGDEGGA